MLRAAAEGSMPVRDVALLEVLYGTGIRASEAAGLRLRDQIPAQRALRVMGKGRKERIVLLGQPAVRALDAWLEERAIRARAKTKDACSCREPVDPWIAKRCGSVSGSLPTRPGFAPCIRTGCVTPLRPTCFEAGPICG